MLDNGEVLVEAGRTLGQSGEEKGQFIVSPQGGVPAKYNSSQHVCMQELKAARSFSNDLLLKKYGGREYASWQEKAVLELSQNASTYACFVSAGDYLVYDAGEWKISSFENLKPDCPVAAVKSVTPRGVDVEAWDETGFYPLPLHIEAEQGGRFQLKPEAMPTSIRLRSGTQISCAFGKKRVILRQGDWLLKTATGWRNLRRTEEIDNFLNRRLKGELMIFDAIEKDQGRLVMKGNLFDETRTQVQAVTFPIEAEKAPGKLSRKRKPLLPNAERRAA
ncbi:MAG: hypothetical protein HYX67_08120 [Candidatus Melainabacteria bacterium]|nr:hypothetical protein [Candidatus Melainabacteria bacterium]